MFKEIDINEYSPESISLSGKSEVATSGDPITIESAVVIRDPQRNKLGIRMLGYGMFVSCGVKSKHRVGDKILVTYKGTIGEPDFQVIGFE